MLIKACRALHEVFANKRSMLYCVYVVVILTLSPLSLSLSLPLSLSLSLPLSLSLSLSLSFSFSACMALLLSEGFKLFELNRPVPCSLSCQVAKSALPGVFLVRLLVFPAYSPTLPRGCHNNRVGQNTHRHCINTVCLRYF